MMFLCSSNCSTFSTYTKTRTNAWKIAKVRQNDDCAAPKGFPLDIKTHQNIKRKKDLATGKTIARSD